MALISLHVTQLSGAGAWVQVAADAPLREVKEAAQAGLGLRHLGISSCGIKGFKSHTFLGAFKVPRS